MRRRKVKKKEKRLPRNSSTHDEATEGTATKPSLCFGSCLMSSSFVSLTYVAVFHKIDFVHSFVPGGIDGALSIF